MDISRDVSITLVERFSSGDHTLELYSVYNRGGLYDSCHLWVSVIDGIENGSLQYPQSDKESFERLKNSALERLSILSGKQAILEHTMQNFRFENIQHKKGLVLKFSKLNNFIKGIILALFMFFVFALVCILCIVNSNNAPLK